MSETVFKIPCKKCGVGIPVDQEMVSNAVALGMNLEPEHETCPGEPAPEPGEALTVRRFRLQLIAAEITTDDEPPIAAFMPGVTDGVEILAGIGTTVEGGTFPEAVNGAFTVWLNAQWPKFQESSAYADLPPATPAPTA